MDQFTTADGGAAGGMTRSSSEWLFQNFLQEAPVAGGLDDDVVEITRPPAAATDPRETVAFRKQQLSMYCAFVARARGPGVKPQDSSPVVISNSQSLDASQLESQTVVKGGGLGGIPAAPVMQNSEVHGKSATSVSSRYLSDDDELEGEMEMTENMDHVDTKHVRRMLSNRESARRSRRRKQAHLIELEAQVSRLRVENSSLLKRLTEANQKYSESVVDNRILKADVETLRAKVNMAEDTVKGMIGMSPMFPTISGLSSVSMPFTRSPSEVTSDTTFSIQDDTNHFFQTSAHDRRVSSCIPEITPAAPPDEDIVHGVVSEVKRGRTASMQRVASLEHLQKRICRRPVQWDATAGWGADISMNKKQSQV